VFRRSQSSRGTGPRATPTASPTRRRTGGVPSAPCAARSATPSWARPTSTMSTRTEPRRR
jgi:hypothetical protein